MILLNVTTFETTMYIHTYSRGNKGRVGSQVRRFVTLDSVIKSHAITMGDHTLILFIKCY